MKFSIFGIALVVLAQSPVPKFIVGTVAGFTAESAEMQVKPDSGEIASIKVTSATVVQRVPPGEKDLKKAAPIRIGDVATGDRVLVNLMPAAFEARRIVVMSSSDIAKRNEADRLDWVKRGVSGVVASKSGGEITLRRRSMQGEIKMTVAVGEATRYRRYAPDSVKFAEAKNGSLSEIGVGDQLRARGQKSEDGLHVIADEVVFGTFVTKAGPITAVNVETKEITVNDLASNKPLVIKLTGDSQLKKLPDFGGMPGGGMPGGPPDLTQMLERIPPIAFEDLKAGDTVVVSSTKGASAGKVTAIMFVANAGMLVRMASMQPAGAAGGRPAGAGGGAGMGPAMGMGGMGGMGGGLGGLDMPGMIP